MPDEESIQIKDYTIHQPPLGEGSFGRVYRATYRGISDRAVKVFDSAAVDLSTMARELEKLSSVAEHHGIVTLHDFDLLADTPYYSMGLHASAKPDGTWETRTLESLCGKIDMKEAWRLLLEIADAVAYLHRNHIIHCDLKPSNILLTDENPKGTKICDFGQSRGDALESFDPAGTPLYASPEQLRSPRDSTEGKGFKWDVYSFGIVAYKLLTGTIPRLRMLATTEHSLTDPEASIVDEGSIDSTLGESRMMDGERLARLTEADPIIKWPSGIQISSERKELIEKCLALAPEDRFSDMREVRNAIKAIDQRRIVLRARRLNTVFATLLAAAIWASGWALLQTYRANQASVQAIETRRQAEELVLFVLNQTTQENLSDPDREEQLYTHIAENAETYLSNLPAGAKSNTLLRLSAKSSSLKAGQARREGNYDEAIDRYESARDIRLKLAETSPNMAILASNDSFLIGEIFEIQGDFEAAIESYQAVYEMRTADLDLTRPLPLNQLRPVIQPLQALARAYLRDLQPLLATANLQKALELSRVAALGLSPADQPVIAAETIPILTEIADIYRNSGDDVSATETLTEILSLAANLSDSDESVFQETGAIAYAGALETLGKIQIDAGNYDIALDYFRDEVRYREEVSDRDPYETDHRIALAGAYANVASAIDQSDTQTRSLAVSNLQQALSILARLPREFRNQPDVENDFIAYNRQITRLLELDE